MSESEPIAPLARAVRPVERGDVPVLAEVLVAAFYDDPVTEYLFPSERSRKRRLERYFTFQLRRIEETGGEALATEDLSGVSLWMPPERRRPGAGAAIEQLLGAVLILGRQTGRAIALIDQLERVRPTEPHLYLAGIGVRPDAQRRGIGSALLRQMLERADREGLTVCLESSREENLAFYNRHGFSVTGEVGSMKGSSPRLWCMQRPPVS